jgi:uncharacterized hydrophobic protein (TIGR00341 family)
MNMIPGSLSLLMRRIVMSISRRPKMACKGLGPTFSTTISLAPYDSDIDGASIEKAMKNTHSRIGIKELVRNVSEMTEPSWMNVLLIALSAITASTGLLENNAAVIIGAMVISPLLGPIMAIALGMSLGNRQMITKGMVAILVGIVSALLLSIMMGIILQVDTGIPELMLRTKVTVLDFAVAFASGIAGALFLTKGMGHALVGVMIAASLLPPLAATGLLLGSGNIGPAMNAMLLFAANSVSMVFAGATTFSFVHARRVR